MNMNAIKTSIMHMPVLDERSDEFDNVQSIRENLAVFTESMLLEYAKYERANGMKVNRSGAIVDVEFAGLRFRMLPMYIGKSNIE